MSPLQSPVNFEHVILHVPLSHDQPVFVGCTLGPQIHSGSLLGGATHFLSHSPQLRLFEPRSLHSSPHCVKPLGQPQAPFQHSSFALHSTPQPPQFFGSSPV